MCEAFLKASRTYVWFATLADCGCRKGVGFLVLGYVYKQIEFLDEKLRLQQEGRGARYKYRAQQSCVVCMNPDS